MKEETSDASAPCRLHIIYKGRVQGVGFRYTTEMIAIKIGLKGWVRNVPRGDVEVVAEGRREKLEEMVAQIKKSNMGPYIRKEVLEWLPYEGTFQDFRLEFFY